MKYFEFSKEKFISILQKIPTWQALRIIGNSRVIQTTIYVPLLGSLILLNEKMVVYLPAWAIDALRGAELTYVGLSLLGIASFAYSVFCPTEIKSYDSMSNYIGTELKHAGQGRSALFLYKAAEDYLRVFCADSIYTIGSFTAMFFPYSIAELFETVIRQVYDKVGFDSETPEDFFVSGTYINNQKVAEILVSRINVYRGIWESFESASKDVLADLLTIRHSVADHSFPVVRIAISVLYLCGFIIVIKPTIALFMKIVAQLFGAAA